MISVQELYRQYTGSESTDPNPDCFTIVLPSGGDIGITTQVAVGHVLGQEHNYVRTYYKGEWCEVDGMIASLRAEHGEAEQCLLTLLNSVLAVNHVSDADREFILKLLRRGDQSRQVFHQARFREVVLQALFKVFPSTIIKSEELEDLPAEPDCLAAGWLAAGLRVYVQRQGDAAERLWTVTVGASTRSHAGGPLKALQRARNAEQLRLEMNTNRLEQEFKQAKRLLRTLSQA